MNIPHGLCLERDHTSWEEHNMMLNVCWWDCPYTCKEKTFSKTSEPFIFMILMVKTNQIRLFFAVKVEMLLVNL